MIGLIGDKYFEAFADASDLRHFPDEDDTSETSAVTQVGPTFREQLVKARRGQGVFRSNVLLVERECRVTHVDEPRHLRASHIKPWREASDKERLNGANGLLLSPHVDHLFDQGYISFSDDSRLMVMNDVRSDLLAKWGIDRGASIESFTREQKAFLSYHQANVFGHPTGERRNMSERFTTTPEQRFAETARWHREQANLPLKEKVRILLELQKQKLPASGPATAAASVGEALADRAVTPRIDAGRAQRFLNLITATAATSRPSTSGGMKSSPRPTCTFTAPAMSTARHAPAIGVRTGRIPVAAGTISPTAPATSVAPISLICASEKSCA